MNDMLMYEHMRGVISMSYDLHFLSWGRSI